MMLGLIRPLAYLIQAIVDGAQGLILFCWTYLYITYHLIV